jgi:hypothetical protein
VFVARLICSNADCSHECEIEAQTFAELEAIACECGCAFQIIGWPNWLDAGESALPMAA